MLKYFILNKILNWRSSHGNHLSQLDCLIVCKNFCQQHCVKSIQIRSFFWSVFSSIRTEYGEMLRNWELSTQCNMSILKKEYRNASIKRPPFLGDFQ